MLVISSSYSDLQFTLTSRHFIFPVIHFAGLCSYCNLIQTIDIYEMCGEKLKAVLRANRETADKKNEEIFSKKRATMGDDEVTQSSASASASASTSAVAGESMR